MNNKTVFQRIDIPKGKKLTIRWVDGKLNMITFSVPFEDLPIGQKFRYGTQQDDYRYIKINEQRARIQNEADLYMVQADRKVLIDFYLY